MYNGQIINKLLEDKRIKKKTLIEYLGGTGGGTVDSIIKGNPTASKLEKIADFFGVSMDVFFIRSIEVQQRLGHNVIGNGNSVGNVSLSTHNQIIDSLNKVLEEKDKLLLEKDKLINEKERTIELLMGKFNLSK